jgi:type IV pilus assembly protein PilQ
MKKELSFTITLIAPFLLWAQASEPSMSEDIDLAEVIIIDDITEPVESVSITGADAIGSFNQNADLSSEVTDTSDVVQIRSLPAAGIVVEPVASMVALPEMTLLPSDSEVVLELPVVKSTGGIATIASEETISVDFPDEDVRTILRNVADLFDLNVVIPDSLQGRTSVKLRNITWRQVFEVVLKQLDYTYVEDRNIIEVISMAELTMEPVDTRVFIVNYAKANEIQNSISPLVDPAAGGRLEVDVRSNALVITERPSRMNKIQEIIDRLDHVTDQVMIESKFIEVSSGDLENIGVDWAYLNENSGDLLGGDGAGSGNPGFNSKPTEDADKDFGRPNGTVIGGIDSYASGLANIAGGGASGGLVAVFSSSQFAATLSALQSEQRSKLVSNPTVVVMNNQQAKFQVGEDYPVRQFSINDQTGQLETGEVEYRFVGVQLDVTPSVNAAGMISMDVHPVVSALGDVVTTQAGVAGNTLLEDRIFKTRDAQTQVTIKDGYTIALGGLTAEEKRDNKSQVPLLGDIPLLGKLFQDNGSSKVSTNLIIFLTAKTLNPDGSNYRDVIDPRQLEAMWISPDEVPGYEVSANEKDLIDQIEAKRAAAEAFEYEMKLRDVLNDGD